MREVSLRIDMGEYVAIMGPSGSGKTTLLQILGGLDVPSSGTIRFLGGDFRAMGDRDRSIVRRRQIGFVFQDSNLVGSLSAVENVALPLLLDGRPRRKALAEALEGLGRLGLDHRAGHYPANCSGGEMQRVAIAGPCRTSRRWCFATSRRGASTRPQAGSSHVVEVDRRTGLAVGRDGDASTPRPLPTPIA